MSIDSRLSDRAGTDSFRSADFPASDDSGSAGAGDVPPVLPFDLDDPFGLSASKKQPRLLGALNRLTAWHQARCIPYSRIVERLFPDSKADDLTAIPYLPAPLFKTLELASVPREQIIKTLLSSGTSEQLPARIYLDRETALRQSRVLIAIMTSLIGKKRLPMVIVDSAALLKDRSRFNARAAGILGFSTLGRDHFHALDSVMRLDGEGLQAYLDKHPADPVFIFGFTSVIWECLLQPSARTAHPLRFPPGSILVHGGGWKRLAEQQVDNATFRHRLQERFGLARIINYYGMVEQVGSIFIECENGHLHSPVFADVIVRNPVTLQPTAIGQRGILQVLSALPLSYPGHSVLTEDLGTLHGEDDCPCGRRGRYFSVSGRLPRAELRGCSDTRVLP